MATIEDHAKHVEKLVNQAAIDEYGVEFWKLDPGDMDALLLDLIADLYHFARYHNFSQARIRDLAEQHFAEEVAGR